MPHSASPAPIRIGCSGWIHRHWRGAFYPAKRAVKHWFQHYAEHFDTVEINTSYHSSRYSPFVLFAVLQPRIGAMLRIAL